MYANWIDTSLFLHPIDQHDAERKSWVEQVNLAITVDYYFLL